MLLAILLQALRQALPDSQSAIAGLAERFGNVWVLLLSIAGLQQQRFAKALHLLGLIVSSLGILTVLHTVPYLKDAFGITQLIWFIWFIWLGITLLRAGRQTSKCNCDAVAAD